jgi:hypothetical protein
MIKLLLLTFAVSPLALVASAAPALAEVAPTGGDFGGQVSSCAQTTGFGQAMNPGVHHRGFSGWDGVPC